MQFIRMIIMDNVIGSFFRRKKQLIVLNVKNFKRWSLMSIEIRLLDLVVRCQVSVVIVTWKQVEIIFQQIDKGMENKDIGDSGKFRLFLKIQVMKGREIICGGQGKVVFCRKVLFLVIDEQRGQVEGKVGRYGFQILEDI